LPNERLQTALHQAGIEVEDLADIVGVDIRTVRRWVGGATPYGRHRTNIAKAVGKPERDLWPEQEIKAQIGDARAEIIAAYPQANDLAAPDWRVLLKAATVQIDLLDYTLTDILTSAGTVDLLAAKAAAGCQIRILISAKDSAQLVIAEAEQGADITLTDIPDGAREAERSTAMLQPLLNSDGVEAREFVAGRFNTILRFDDHMLLALHTYGTPGSHASLLHLRRKSEAGLFERFAAHYDAIWQEAGEPIRPDIANSDRAAAQPSG